MPSKKGLCWCWGGRAPPEITYGIENGAMTLKQIETDAPMPQDEHELNAMFAELVVSTVTSFFQSQLARPRRLSSATCFPKKGN